MNKKISDEDFRRLPEWLFHGTGIETLDSIADNGFGARRTTQKLMGEDDSYDGVYKEDGFFFTPDMKEAYGWIQFDDRFEEKVVIGIPKRALDPKNIYYDTNNEYTEWWLDDPENNEFTLVTFFYNGVIPQKELVIAE